MEYRKTYNSFNEIVRAGVSLSVRYPVPVLTSVPVHVGGGLGLQVSPCVLHRLGGCVKSKHQVFFDILY